MIGMGGTVMGTVNPRRWDGDERGTGMGHGLASADGPRALLAAMAAPGWVTEDPDAHLLPHLRRACAEPGSPWTLDTEALDDAGVYRIGLTWTRADGSMRSLTADLFALVGTVAENQTHIGQIIDGDAVIFRVATGMMPGDGGFSGHGHLLAVRITGPRIPALITGARPGGGRSALT